MKKLFLLLTIPLILVACTPAPISHTEFETADCSEEPTDPVVVEWDWVVFDLPWCWTIKDLGSEEKPLLVLKDQDGLTEAGGLITFTYDPTAEELDLQVVATHPESEDTILILNSFRE